MGVVLSLCCVMLELMFWCVGFKREDYYQEGSNVYHELAVLEAFRKALTTWGRWVEKNVNPEKSLVFFRGFSATHFRYHLCRVGPEILWTIDNLVKNYIYVINSCKKI